MHDLGRTLTSKIRMILLLWFSSCDHYHYCYYLSHYLQILYFYVLCCLFWPPLSDVAAHIELILLRTVRGYS